MLASRKRSRNRDGWKKKQTDGRRNEGGYESKLKELDFWDVLGDNGEIKHVVFSEQPASMDIYALTGWALEHGKTVSQFMFARGRKEVVADNLQEAVREAGEAEIFLFFEDNKQQCLDNNLNFYAADGYIAGCKGILDGAEPQRLY